MYDYFPSVGGAQFQTHFLSEELINKGHNVTVYANSNQVRLCNKYGFQHNYELKGVKCPPEVIIKRSQRFWLYLLGKKFKDLALQDDLEILQLIMAWPWLPVANIIKNIGVPITIRSGGEDIQINKSLNYGVWRDKVRTTLLYNGFKSISKAISISSTITKEYINFGVPLDRIVEINPGINYNIFKSYMIKISHVRSKWKIPIDKDVIITVGRNHPKKGFIDLIRSLKILNKNNNKYVIVIVGDNCRELIPEAKKINQEDNFIPIELKNNNFSKINNIPSQELIQLYKASDYFVLPSYIEGYPNVTLEAAAAGIPVIVTDAPGCRDAVDDGVDGLIVPIRSPDKIAESILRLGNDLGLREKIIMNGKRKAEKQDWDNVALQYLQVYESLI